LQCHFTAAIISIIVGILIPKRGGHRGARYGAGKFNVRTLYQQKHNNQPLSKPGNREKEHRRNKKPSIHSTISLNPQAEHHLSIKASDWIQKDGGIFNICDCLGVWY
jgi:hypothetical protein